MAAIDATAWHPTWMNRIEVAIGGYIGGYWRL